MAKSSRPRCEGAGDLRGWIACAATGCARLSVLTVTVAGVLTLVALVYAAHNFAIDTDSAKLISSRLPWRQRGAVFDAAFPQRSDLIAIVVDGATPEIAERASAMLSERLVKSELLHDVRRPDGGPFFERNGLLFLSADELSRTTEQLVAAQAVIGTLAADPSVRGLMSTLQLALAGVERGEITLDALRPGLTVLAATLESVQGDRPKPLSWRAMLGGAVADPRELRRFILAQPVLDFTALKPGERATQYIREVARASGLDLEHGVRIRLTGDVPMADEEFATLEDHAGRNAAVMSFALLAMLWLAVRSVRTVIAIVVCLIVGLALTAATGLLIYGAFNLISVAFAVLFVGLGVDFGIQYAVAYRSTAPSTAPSTARASEHPEIERAVDPIAALRRAALEVGGSLALAAVSIALGFFAFEPTDYRGVSELGVVAGIGMLIAFLASITLLPALLRLFRVGGMPEGMGFAGLARVDRQLVSHRRRVLLGASVVAVVSIALLPFVRFDFNPLHLRSSQTEAVATVMDLARNAQTTPNTIDVLSPSLDAAKALGDKLSGLPEVSQVLTLASFVPDEQEPKLALIADAALLLEPTLNPMDVKPAPSDEENARAMRDAAHALQTAATHEAASVAAADATRVSRALEGLAEGSATRRRALDDTLIPGLRTTLAQLRSSLLATPVTLATLPPALAADWVARDGRARIEVFPHVATRSEHSDGSANAIDEDESLRRFVAAVRGVAPEATGAVVSIQESARTIVRAFVEAGALALLTIGALLALVLRRTRDVLITLASLSLGGLVTLGFCVVLRIPLNYANIIALPLLFGIGVAFNIYFVIAWRRGTRNLLQTSIARAVIFSALTTATAFGSLWLSSHPGTASMGKLLALSLACTLAAALFVLPAMLGPGNRVD